MALKMCTVLDFKKRFKKAQRAFTLVELLVVIGIIAVLIGILLPSLAAARQTAQRAACGAKLQQIMVAANLFAIDHKGYYPLAGFLNTKGSFDPPGVNDQYQSHYAWMIFNPPSTPVLLAPITFALGTEMGYKKNLAAQTMAAQIYGDTDKFNVIRHFLCPSQANEAADIPYYSLLYAGYIPPEAYGEQLSYVFNEAVLGYDDVYGRLRGKQSLIRQTSQTMFCADGFPGSYASRPTESMGIINFGPGVPVGPYGVQTVYNIQNFGPVTLSDALTHRLNGKTALAGDPQNFDQVRHKGKMNIAFCDGHVELRTIPPFTLSSKSNTTPIMTYDPQAKALQNVYLLPP